jgi:hypothetical protein
MARGRNGELHHAARNKIIILDSCHSGIAGDRATTQGVSENQTRDDSSHSVNG